MSDLISREALKKTFENLASDDYNEPIWYQKTVFETIDNAPTVDATCPHCDSGYAQGYSDGYLRAKEDVIHSIAKQYSEHNELVPIWLSIGDIKGGAE